MIEKVKWHGAATVKTNILCFQNQKAVRRIAQSEEEYNGKIEF